MIRLKSTAFIAFTIMLSLATGTLFAQQSLDPPWNPSPEGGVHFTIPGIDNVPDLYGDINDPQLVVFFAGNQFMVVHDLVAAFRKQYPQYQRIFIETLPPGILARQITQGSLVIGNQRITLKPDLFTAGSGRIAALSSDHHWFSATSDYARNRLAIMVYKNNPENIHSLADLARPEVRVSMPNPEWEGIGRVIEKAYRKAGGEPLVQGIMSDKKKNGTTYLTHIHHRQTPLRIMHRESDAGPVWYTEAYFQQKIGHPVASVPIPDEHNVTVTYTAGILKQAPHPKAARDFLNFLSSPDGQKIYRSYGFMPPK